MSTFKTSYNRRSFLKSSLASGGGLMLGFSWLASCTPASKDVALVMPDEWFDLNAFLKVGDNGVVTIMSPNPEIGQNVKTAMPMIVAEELDVAWKNVVVEQAPLNTVKYTRQLAGGSQSIRQGWESLRMAGATARRLLVEAAAKEWEVPATEVTTSEGVLSHEKSGRKAGYGEMASAAGNIEVPEEVTLKDPRDFSIIGSSQQNVDAAKIVKGEPLFGLDTYRDGMLVATVVHPPAFGLKLKSFDASSVTSMSGIQDVVEIDLRPEGIELQWSDTTAFPKVVAIVGDSTWEVMKARKAIQVEWEQDSAAESTSDHEATLAALLSKPGEGRKRQDGDAQSAFASAAQVVERTFKAPFLAHNTMEPMNFFAHVTESDAELVGPIQTPEYLQLTVAALLGMPVENVSIMMTRMGGGFGRRLYGHFGAEAALISQKVGAPIKLIYSREDDMTQGTYRPAYSSTYRAALDADGNLTGFHIRGAGMKGGPVFLNRFPAGAVDHFLAENHVHRDTNVSTGAWRAPGSNFTAGVEQAFLDEVAEAAGKDPIDFRLELFDRAINDPVGEKHDYDAERYAGVLKLVREKSGWDTKVPGTYRGVSAYYCHNSYVAQVVDVIMEDDQPRVKKVWCAVDCGIVVNPGSARNQIEGGIVDGIGHSMYSALSFTDGRPNESNFDRYRLIRNSEAPLEIETFFVDNGIDPTGLGEPSLPPISGALANALYQATGERLSEQPFNKEEAILG